METIAVIMNINSQLVGKAGNGIWVNAASSARPSLATRASQARVNHMLSRVLHVISSQNFLTS